MKRLAFGSALIIALTSTLATAQAHPRHNKVTSDVDVSYVQTADAVYFEHDGQVRWFPRLKSHMFELGEYAFITYGSQEVKPVADAGELKSAWRGKKLTAHVVNAGETTCRFNAPPLTQKLYKVAPLAGRDVGGSSTLGCAYWMKLNDRSAELRNLSRNNQIVSAEISMGVVPLEMTADGIRPKKSSTPAVTPKPTVSEPSTSESPKPSPTASKPEPTSTTTPVPPEPTTAPETPSEDPKPSTDQPAPESPSGDGTATIIKHGWDIPYVDRLSRPAFVKEVADSPFDGVVFTAGKSGRIMSDRLISYEEAQEALSAHKDADFGRPMHNYLMLYSNQFGGGWGNDADVKRMNESAENVARAAKEAGFEGIFFDIEVYEKNPWNVPKGACKSPSLTVDQCKKAAYRSGQEFMEALRRGFPDVKVVSTFGPWLDDRRTAEHIQKYAWAGQWANAKNDVEGEFLSGLFKATVGNDAQYIDGGELYGLRTQDDFQKTAEWMRSGTVQNSPVIPEEVRADYTREVGIGFGLYDGLDGLFEDEVSKKKGEELGRLSPTTWRTMIKNSKREADLVWLYTEREDWWHEDGNPWPEKRVDRSGAWFQETLKGLKD